MVWVRRYQFHSVVASLNMSKHEATYYIFGRESDTKDRELNETTMDVHPEQDGTFDDDEVTYYGHQALMTPNAEHQQGTPSQWPTRYA